MDAVTMYHLGQIRQQEILDEARQDYLSDLSAARPSLWTRLTAHLSALKVQREGRRECSPQSQALA